MQQGVDADQTRPQPAAPISRRRPSQDLSISGRMLPPFWAAAAVALLFTGLSTSGADRWWPLGGAAMAAVACAGMWMINWTTVPPIIGRLAPGLACAMIGVIAWASPSSIYMLLIGAALVTMWTGVALDRSDLVIVSLVVGASLIAPLSHHRGVLDTVYLVAACWTVLLTIGFAMQWLRTQLDAISDTMLQAQRESAATQAEAAAVRQRAAQEHTAAANAALAERIQVQRQIAAQSAVLAEAVQEVGEQTAAVASASTGMSHAVDDLTRTAHVTNEITSSVAVQAREAAQLMDALAASSSQITAASDVIQAVAEQTNLLALNATIESARAGEAGRGFAVVANEVKDLARLSGENADAITRTLAEVRAQVAAAVERVNEITTSIGELSSHHGSLAAALEEQATSVRQITASVHESATHAGRITTEVLVLEQLSRDD